jgi:hypothetical protein
MWKLNPKIQTRFCEGICRFRDVANIILAEGSGKPQLKFPGWYFLSHLLHSSLVLKLINKKKQNYLDIGMAPLREVVLAAEGEKHVETITYNKTSLLHFILRIRNSIDAVDS